MMSKLRNATLFLLVILIGVAFLWPAHMAKSSSPVVINEIMWAGNEYVELYNPNSEIVSLSGWKLLRQKPDQPEPELVVTIGAGKEVTAQGFFLLATGSAFTTAVTVDNSWPASKLVDDGELLLLQDATGVVIDSANRQGKWFAGKKDGGNTFSMERNSPDASGTEPASWHSSTGIGGGRNGTPRLTNSEANTNQAPLAVLSAPANGLVGQAIAFAADDSSDPEGDPLIYSWNFGDGQSATGVSVSHAYATEGSFTVELTVSDGNVSTKISQPISITQPNYSTAVVVNEFLPNPAGTDTNNEFIELFNTGDSAVDLSGWQIDDIAEGSSPYTFPAGTTIAPHGFLTIMNSVSYITLNNDGDSVRLLSPDKIVRNETSYAVSIPEGQSLNRLTDGSFMVSTTLTPGEANTITAPTVSSPSPTNVPVKIGRVAGTQVMFVPLEKIRAHKDKEVIITQGAVSAPPGTFKPNMLYVAGSGILVTLPKEFVQKIRLGDVLQITGTLDTYFGECRLVIKNKADVVKLKSGPAPAAHDMLTGNVGVVYEGSLARIQGRITKLDGDTFFVDDGTGPAKVVIQDATGIARPRLKQGTFADIIGIISHTTSGYRLLPRFQNDIQFGGNLRKAVTGKVAVLAKPKKQPRIGGAITTQAPQLLPPTPSVMATPLFAPTPTAPQKKSGLDPSLVFVGCLLAIAFLVRGAQMKEPLLASPGNKR